MDKCNLYDAIARVAYSLYEERGRLDGYQIRDWLEAEKIVMAQHAKGPKNEVKTAKAVKKKTSSSDTKQKEVKSTSKVAPSKARKTTSKS